MKRLVLSGLLACVAASAAAHPARHQHTSVAEKASKLRPGEYVWEARARSRGPLFIVIDLGTQRATLYRNGVIIGISTVSTGSRGRGTPTGVFTILQKEIVHRSRTYDGLLTEDASWKKKKKAGPGSGPG